jgi:proteic killer suppression protein
VIVSFADRQTEAIYHGEATAAARKRLPLPLWPVAHRKLDQLGRVGRLDQLAVPPGNRLEALRGDRAGQHSIRINERYRICFVWTEQGPADVEIVDYHG